MTKSQAVREILRIPEFSVAKKQALQLCEETKSSQKVCYLLSPKTKAILKLASQEQTLEENVFFQKKGMKVEFYFNLFESLYSSSFIIKGIFPRETTQSEMNSKMKAFTDFLANHC
jgi:hypothetical protein